MNKKTKLIIVGVFALLTFFAFGGLKASAIEYGMLGGKPAYPDSAVPNSNSWFIYSLGPGEAKEDGLTVMNLFEESRGVSIYAADSSPSSSGGFGVKGSTESKDEVGSWVRFYPDKVPDRFSQAFKDHEESIIKLCALNHDDLQKELDEKNKDSKDKDTYSEEDFAQLDVWCQGVELIDRTLAAKEQIIIPFIFRVPAEVEVGEHTGGILIEKHQAEDSQTEGGSSIKLTTRVGVRIYETVPGEIVKKLSVGDFKLVKNFSEFDFSDWFGKNKKPREYSVQLQVRDEGNVSITHKSNIQIVDQFFGKRTEYVEREFQVLRNDKFISNLSWEKPLFGRYTFQGEIKYQGNEGEEVIKTGVLTLWVIPWREIAVALGIIVIIALVYLACRWFKKKKYGGIGWSEYVVRDGDTVAELAKYYDVNWKVFVKTNRLKAPFVLAPGETILIPGEAKNSPVKQENKIVVEELRRPVEEDSITQALDSQAPDSAAEAKVEQEAPSVIPPRKRGRPRKNPPKEEIVETSAVEIPVREELNDDNKTVEINVEPSEAVSAEAIEPVVTDKIGKFQWIGSVMTIIGWAATIFALIFGVWYAFNYFRGTGNSSDNKIPIQRLTETHPLEATAEPISSPEPAEQVVPVTEESNQESSPQQPAQSGQESPAVDSNQNQSNNNVSIKVLNGGAAPGVAGKIAEDLKALGYANVESANANSRSFVGQTVYFSENNSIVAKKITDLLIASYPKIIYKSAETEAQKQADVVILLGK